MQNSITNCKVCFVHPQTNQVVHNLARVVRFYVGLHWFSSFIILYCWTSFFENNMSSFFSEKNILINWIKSHLYKKKNIEHYLFGFISCPRINLIEFKTPLKFEENSLKYNFVTPNASRPYHSMLKIMLNRHNFFLL